jgi:hypothetical protein
VRAADGQRDHAAHGFIAFVEQACQQLRVAVHAKNELRQNFLARPEQAELAPDRRGGPGRQDPCTRKLCTYTAHRWLDF